MFVECVAVCVSINRPFLQFSVYLLVVLGLGIPTWGTIPEPDSLNIAHSRFRNTQRIQ